MPRQQFEALVVEGHAHDVGLVAAQDVERRQVGRGSHQHDVSGVEVGLRHEVESGDPTGRHQDLVGVGRATEAHHSGGAGLAAALAASARGSRVIVLEKSELLGGTTAMSGGGVWIPCSPKMARLEATDSRDDALAYIRALAKGSAPDESLFEVFVDTGAEAIAFLEEHSPLEMFATRGFECSPTRTKHQDLIRWPVLKPFTLPVGCFQILSAD